MKQKTLAGREIEIEKQKRKKEQEKNKVKLPEVTRQEVNMAKRIAHQLEKFTFREFAGELEDKYAFCISKNSKLLNVLVKHKVIEQESKYLYTTT